MCWKGSFVNDRFSFVTFTRDASTNIISVYVGTTPAGTYKDDAGDYVPSAQDVIFMMDNTTGPANIVEASPGTVTYIALIDTPATPGDIAGLQAQACASVVAQTFPITVSASPAGGGVASCSPNPVLSGDDSICTATPNPGFAFVNWSGDCSGTTCTLSNVTSAKSVTANFVGTADVQVSKTGPANVTGGNPVVYTLVFTNTGPGAADGAVWSDPVPAEISSVSASCGAVTGGAVCGSPTVAGNSVTGAIPTFPSKSSVTVTISGVSPLQTTTLVNTATIDPPAGVPDSDTTNNSSTASTSTPVHLQSFEVD